LFENNSPILVVDTNIAVGMHNFVKKNDELNTAQLEIDLTNSETNKNTNEVIL
jgi:hypothetical protein